MRIDVVADRQFLRGNHTLRLEADVEQDFVLVDTNDRAFDDLAVIEVDKSRIDGVIEADVAKVIDGDLSRSKYRVGWLSTVLSRGCLRFRGGFGGGGRGLI